MAENKTKPGTESVKSFLETIEEPKREDCKVLIKMMRKITVKQPMMWGGNMVGFGFYHYKYASGHEGEWFMTGFSPRKVNLTIYLIMGFERYKELLEKFGKHRTAKSCLYIKSLKDIDVKILELLIEKSYNCMIHEKSNFVS